MRTSSETHKPNSNRLRCAITGQEVARRDLVMIDTLRPRLADLIRQENPSIESDSFISRVELNKYRSKFVQTILEQEHGEAHKLDQKVAQSIANHEMLAENIDEEYVENRTFAENMADRLASFGGSWRFISFFLITMVTWITINTLHFTEHAFDPYPFILLNLVLSCIAALQAPIIMMSQNRQEQKDRLRSHNDYLINLKAELEIRHLHEKVDHLITRQWERLAEIQQLQIELMQELTRKSVEK